jgi:hypothetical protein
MSVAADITGAAGPDALDTHAETLKPKPMLLIPSMKASVRYQEAGGFDFLSDADGSACRLPFLIPEILDSQVDIYSAGPGRNPHQPNPLVRHRNGIALQKAKTPARYVASCHIWTKGAKKYNLSFVNIIIILFLKYCKYIY